MEICILAAASTESGLNADKEMKEPTELLSKPPVGGMELCQSCGHHQWEHNVDIVLDGKIVRPKTEERQDGVCLHAGSRRCCVAFCRQFEPSA
jgi:hypothetical protein